MSLSELSQQPGKVESIIKPVQYVAEPLALYRSLCEGRAHNLLLESAEIDSKDDLKSLMLIDAALRLECNNHKVNCQALTSNGAAILPLLAQACDAESELSENQLTLTFTTAQDALDEDSRLKAHSVFDALRQIILTITPLRQHPDALFIGGVFAYDMLANFEQLPDVQEGINSCPDFVFYVAETLLLIDHQQQTSELIGSVFSGADVANQYFAVSQRLELLEQQIANPQPIANSNLQQVSIEQLSMDKSDDEFKQDVNQLKEHILCGDIFQVVPSRTFSLPCPHPFNAYQQLKQQNPSPYMFYLQDSDFCLFGASPESALKYQQESNQVEIYPIAGTRPRGLNPDGSIDRDLDSRIELELRQDEKEKAEHIMLVDLARNDVARVSEPGSRYVADLLQVDRYSQVMHLVSRVVGQLRNDLDALHAYQACMNMGTLVGAPKVSAAKLIREVEQQRRGSYGGAVGYINGQGDMDTCIVIRSAFVKNGMAHIQAGAGVVYDSDPQSEADETRAKAQAVIHAIVAAHSAAL
ncbi:anthranilate synthase component 1 [Neptunicella marina]|uniref:Anthranilate synthase component 1 n=1 Tax=Neptunicella marina TaxID=2125989 RepID=A0A8J6IP65_9ALTE|nr:anthranilate synthase component 1 [Neptunicella marina]MBC3764671.1 anthranilate synthase component 1 [Neptunicella marina]